MAELLLFFFDRSQGYHQVRTLFVINVINVDESMLFVFMDQFAAGRRSTAIYWNGRRRTVLTMHEKLKKYNIKSMKKKEIINELQD